MSIIVKLKGGLGNQMFQYAFGKALAERHQTALKLDVSFLKKRPKNPNYTLRDFDLDIFENAFDFAENAEVRALAPVDASDTNGLMSRFWQKLRVKWYQNIAKTYHLEASPAYNEAFLSKIGSNAYLEGYFQTERYFESIADLMRAQFRFRIPLSNDAQRLAERIQSAESVCIFVRRTDFLTDPAQIGLDKAQILRGIEMLKKEVANPELFIFSDDIEWCQAHLTFDLPAFFVTHAYKGERFSNEMELMTLCRHFIIPISSFGWWAAWLSTSPGKIVLHPSAPQYPDWSARGWRIIE